MHKPVFAGIRQHNCIHSLGTCLPLNILQNQLAADVYITGVAVWGIIFPGLQIKRLRLYDQAGLQGGIGRYAVFLLHQAVFGIGGEAFIQPCFFKLVTGHHTIEVLMPDLMNDGALQ
ncbi:hypothetical protein D3C73_1167480 [compost metagenome]